MSVVPGVALLFGLWWVRWHSEGSADFLTLPLQLRGKEKARAARCHLEHACEEEEQTDEAGTGEAGRGLAHELTESPASRCPFNSCEHLPALFL